jgi:hypothetical protein
MLSKAGFVFESIDNSVVCAWEKCVVYWLALERAVGQQRQRYTAPSQHCAKIWRPFTSFFFTLKPIESLAVIMTI